MSQGQQGNDTGLAPLYIVFIVFILLAVLYHSFHEPIVRIFFIIKSFDLKLVSLFNPNYELLLNWSDKTLQSTVSAEQLYYLALNVGLVFHPNLQKLKFVFRIHRQHHQTPFSV